METPKNTIVRLLPKQKKCLKCGQDFFPTARFQGGGRQNYCSRKCSVLAWAHNNKQRVKESQQRYAEKPENREKKNQCGRIRNKITWLRLKPEYKMWMNARRSAKDHNVDCTIQPEDIKIPSHCPLLNIPLIPAKGRCTENSPSIDRIDSTKGYTPDNVWVISFKANTAKSNLTLSEIKMLAKNLELKMIEGKVNEKFE